MGNGFRRIALAQGLLSQAPAQEPASKAPNGWTDDELSALLQVAAPPSQIDPAQWRRGTARRPAPEIGPYFG